MSKPFGRNVVGSLVSCSLLVVGDGACHLGWVMVIYFLIFSFFSPHFPLSHIHARSPIQLYFCT
ncbi:hypothetical protein BJX64DRAFT_272366 [Aspergillus heterothallicus]